MHVILYYATCSHKPYTDRLEETTIAQHLLDDRREFDKIHIHPLNRGTSNIVYLLKGSLRFLSSNLTRL